MSGGLGPPSGGVSYDGIEACEYFWKNEHYFGLSLGLYWQFAVDAKQSEKIGCGKIGWFGPGFSQCLSSIQWRRSPSTSKSIRAARCRTSRSKPRTTCCSTSDSKSRSSSPLNHPSVCTPCLAKQSSRSCSGSK